MFKPLIGIALFLLMLAFILPVFKVLGIAALGVLALSPIVFWAEAIDRLL